MSADPERKETAERPAARSGAGLVRVNDEMLARVLVAATRNSLKYSMEQALVAIQRARAGQQP